MTLDDQKLKAANDVFDEQRERNNVIDFEKAAKAKGKTINKGHSINVSGNNNTVAGNVNGNKNIVAGRYVVNTKQHVTKTIAEVKPGTEHIDDEQKRNLRMLVDDIVEIEKAVKRKPSSYGKVWKMLTNHCKVTKYVLIKRYDYEKARNFLLKWRGGLRGMKSAPKKVKSWRTDRSKAIHAIINRFKLESPYRRYIKNKFGAESTLELVDEELDKAYRHVLYLKGKVLKENRLSD